MEKAEEERRRESEGIRFCILDVIYIFLLRKSGNRLFSGSTKFISSPVLTDFHTFVIIVTDQTSTVAGFQLYRSN